MIGQRYLTQTTGCENDTFCMDCTGNKPICERKLSGLIELYKKIREDSF